MEIGLLQDATIDAMGNYLGRLSKRQQVIASNIANIDTPGFKSKDVSFYATMEELMTSPASGMKATRPEHLERWTFAPAEPEIFEETGLPSGLDQNNVDIDREMLKLGQTSFGYSAVAQLLRTKFRIIASGINEGRIG